ncbi:MAG: tetratricopeptide (TPR) repeat protein [Crocinitomix sp.]|jgi:tetratricopeptide (TPR) repeat protein
MKLLLTKRTLIVLMLSFLSYSLFAQDQFIIIDSKVINDESGKALKGAIITTFKDDTFFRSDTSKSNGKVNDIKIPVGVTYKVVIEKPGYVSKMAFIDARLVEPSDMPPMDITLKFYAALFEECDAGDYEFMKTEPIIKWSFNSAIYLEYDKDSLKVMLKKLNAAKYANLSTEDQETFTSNYFGGMELMEFQKFNEGLELLLKAKKIVDCPFVINKIEECEAKQQTAAYFNFITIGDSLFNDGKYQEANAAYRQACDIRPKEKYPFNQMVEIQYKKIILKADECFADKDYEKALKYYDRAIKLKPYDDSFKKNHAKCRKKVK